jgi:hypothetical protein
MILLAHLKFCLNFGGAVFEAKVAPAKDPRQKKICWRVPENTLTGIMDSWVLHLFSRQFMYGSKI